MGPRPRLKPLLRFRSDYLDILRISDIVVDIGEGDSWTDIYGGTRFAFQAGTKIAALALGKPLVLAPQTIGPFNSAIRRRIAFAIMSRSRAVFARDSASFNYLDSGQLSTEICEFIDVAFHLPFELKPRNNYKTRIGMNISGLLYRGGYKEENEFHLMLDYPALMHQLIEHWSTQHQIEIHLVPHVISPDSNDDDSSIALEFSARYPQLVVPPPFRSAVEAKSYMSGLDFVVGGRMHACIGAFSAGTPVVPIAYSRKFNGLFDTLGYPHYIDGRTVNTTAALALILAHFDRREQLSTDLQQGLSLAASRLDEYEAKLATILDEVA
jgi:polysaccharide pyruvyl transferase WcaK-like protein